MMERGVTGLDLLHEAQEALKQGRIPRARAYALQLLALSADLPVLQFLSEVEIAAQAPGNALEWAKQARALDPENAWTNHLLAVALRGLGQDPLAQTLWRQALASDPTLEPAYQGLAGLLTDQKAFGEAEQVYAAWASQRPRRPGLWLSRGKNLALATLYAEAEECFRRADRLYSPFPEALTSLAWVLRRQGRLSDAADVLEKAIQALLGTEDAVQVIASVSAGDRSYWDGSQSPAWGAALWSLASVYLLQGRYPEGLAAFEARFLRGRSLLVKVKEPIGSAPQGKPLPWTGDSQALKGQHLWVRHEQGLGDALHMMRYARTLKGLGVGEISWEAPSALHGVMERADGIDTVTPLGMVPDRADLFCPMMSLPHLLLSGGSDPVPAGAEGRAAYITLAAQGAAGHSAGISAPKAFRIGLVWRGNPEHEDDAARSAVLDDLEPLICGGTHHHGLPVEWVCLQLPDNRPDYDPAKHGAWFVDDAGGRVQTFEDTAEVLGGLDLLISVDTALLHLAGAMAKPVWALLPFATDWRWFSPDPSQQETPWYPSVRLWRLPGPHRLGEPGREQWRTLAAKLALEIYG